MMERALRLRHHPLIHFLILGAALFVADRWHRNGAVGEPAPIVVSADDVAALRRGWQEQFGGMPTAAEERVLIDQAVDEEMLYREALADGLDRSDRIVYLRLAELGRFLRLAPDDDQPALVAAADRLGLEQRDVLLRRHLAEMGRLALAKGSTAELPSEAEVRAYYDQHAADFTQPARLELTQVYFSAQRRGGALEADARRALGKIRQRHFAPAQAVRLGDPFIHGTHIGLSSPTEIERLFGAEFTSAVSRAATNTWVGPIRSSYGMHLVWVQQTLGAQAAPFDSVRSQVLHALLRERATERLHERLASLRQRYRVVVDTQS